MPGRPGTGTASRRVERLAGPVPSGRSRHGVVGLLALSVGVAGEAGGVGSVHRIVDRPGPAPEAGLAVVGEGALDAGPVVHHEWPVLGDRLTDRTALQHERLGAGRPGDEG